MKTLAWIIMALFVCTQWSILTIEALPSSTPLIIDSAHVGLRNKTTGVVIPWECHVCEEGSGLSVECGRTFDIGTYIGCVKCRKGVTFSDKRDIGQCKQCNSCSRNEIRIGRCEVDKNTVKCICKAEFYRDEGSRDCKPCSWCCHGKINQVVEKCKKFPKLPMGMHCSFQDAKQCAPMPKPTNSAETLHQWSEFPPPSTSKEIIITDNKEEQDVQEGKGKGNSTHTTFIILIVVLPCCAIIFTAIVPIAYTRSRQSSARRLYQQRHEEEIIPLQILSPPTSESELEEIPIGSNNCNPEQASGANEQQNGVPLPQQQQPGRHEERSNILNQEQPPAANQQNVTMPRQQPRGANEQNDIMLEQHPRGDEDIRNVSSINPDLSQRQESEDGRIVQPNISLTVSLPHQSSVPITLEEERKKRKEKIHLQYGPKVENMPHDVKHQACMRLNPLKELKGNDYRAIADKVGMNSIEIAYISEDKQNGRMTSVFELMISQGKTINDFVDILYDKERYDVVDKMYDMAMACNTD